MKRLFTIVCMVIITNIVMTSIVSAEVVKNVNTSKNEEVESEFFEADNAVIASREHERTITKEYTVSSSPSLSINNSFGNIKIIEGADNKIVFNITITGKGNDIDIAKKYAETVDVKFIQNGNNVSAKTEFGKMNCKNCGRSVNYEVTVPKNTKHLLENKFGDINVNNISEPLEIKLEFGKLFANVLSDVNLFLQYGEATINKCGDVIIKSGFSKYKIGEINSITGDVSYDGFNIEELASADVKSGFTNFDIQKLKKSFLSKNFSYGSLKVKNVDYNFSEIKINASFSKINIPLDEKHNFKATLYCSFGNIKTGKVVFLEKSLDKKDAIVGIAGNVKEPSALVDLSNSYGDINLQ